MEKQTIGIIGAGVIGSSVAQSIAQNGLEVIMVDISQEVLTNSKITIEKNMRLQSIFQKTKIEDTASILEKIKFSSDINTLSNADFVIESVTEKWPVKKEVYVSLDKICNRDCVIASNTSAIPITKLASVTKRKDRIIGLHFMNPVPLISGVEMIKGVHTSEKTIELTKEFLKKIGKSWIMVNDSPGFISNRILMLTINEAVFTLQENIASAADIDKTFKSCFGHKMGPLETADLIGLDTILYSIEVLYESFNDSKYRPCSLLKKMVDAGYLGRKSGKGFYEYYV